VTIELIKDIKLCEMEFVGEVDFFEESPYIKLLQNFKTEKELIEELENKNMPESAIKNIIQKLTDLKVLENGYIENIKDGFPEKEYGKYTVEYFENDTSLPFKFINKDIKREKAASKNTADNINQDKNFIKMVQDKTNNKFRINSISNDKAKISNMETGELVVRMDIDKWKYIINGKLNDMDSILYVDLFKGEWDTKYNALMISFTVIMNQDNFLKSFQISYSDDIELENYGKFKGKFKDIEIIPKTQYDAKEWFIYLLKDEIEQLNRYISKEELYQLWENTKEKYHKFKKFDLEFDFEMILKKFGKSSKYYWLLQAGIELYPFDTNIVPKERVIIESIEDYKSKFNINIKELTVMDRYLNSKRNLAIFENILKNFDNPNVTIFTTEDHYKKESDEIENFIDRHNIKKIIKEKNEIEHTRHWIVNNSLIYRTGESTDGIHNTSFDLFELDDIKKIAPRVIKLLEEI
jgi:putative sterol carrier protein